jgi:hypothetical protein
MADVNWTMSHTKGRAQDEAAAGGLRLCPLVEVLI